jgi:hypothetical protein
MKKITVCIAWAMCFGCLNIASVSANPWADSVVEYVAGTGIGNDFVTGNPFDNPLVALGEPTRFTSDDAHFGGATTPFQAAFRDDEIVSVGKGGHLTVAFDEPVTDGPLNPFGIDLLVFGNAFYDLDFSTFLATGVVADEGGKIEVSSNGVDFFEIAGASADGNYPTLGYLDLAEEFPAAPGLVPSDFTKPVNPTLDVAGLGIADILAAYDGSGGGTGIDIGPTGLSEISYVRISVANDAAFVPEIDGFADVRAVPEPAGVLILTSGLAVLGFFRRR